MKLFLSSKHLAAASLMAVACSQSTLAQTLVTASSSVTNLRYHLVDLDPNDGVTPWVSFDLYDYMTHQPAGVGSSTFDLAAYAGFQTGSESSTTSLTGNVFSADSGSVSTVRSSLLASKNANNMVASAQVTEADLANPTYREGANTWVYTASSSVNFGYGNLNGIYDNFALSAHTAFVIDGVSDSGATIDTSSLTQGALASYVDGPNESISISTMGIANLYISAFLLNEKTQFYERQEAYGYASSSSKVLVDATGTHVLPSVDQPNEHTPFELVFTNDKSQYVTGTMLWYVYNNIEIANYVPEPDTWALFGLGLLGIAFKLKRTRPH